MTTDKDAVQDDGEVDFFTVVRKDHELEQEIKDAAPISAPVPKKIKLNNTQAKRIRFNDDGKAITIFEALVKDINQNKQDLREEQEKYAAQLKQNIKVADVEDKKYQKLYVKDKREQKKQEMEEIKYLQAAVDNLEDKIYNDKDVGATKNRKDGLKMSLEDDGQQEDEKDVYQKFMEKYAEKQQQKEQQARVDKRKREAADSGAPQPKRIKLSEPSPKVAVTVPAQQDDEDLALQLLEKRLK